MIQAWFCSFFSGISIFHRRVPWNKRRSFQCKFDLIIYSNLLSWMFRMPLALMLCKYLFRAIWNFPCTNIRPLLTSLQTLNVLQQDRTAYKKYLHTSTMTNARHVFGLQYVRKVWCYTGETSKHYAMATSSEESTDFLAIKMMQKHLLHPMKHIKFSEPTWSIW